VTITVGAGISSEHDPLEAGVAAAGAARSALGAGEADLALVFASGAHLAAPEAALEGVHSVLAPKALVGCGAGGVLGVGRELESGTALAVWAASFGGAGRATAFAASAEPDAAVAFAGLPELTDATAAIMLVDPYSFATDAVLVHLADAAPEVPVLGGIASARTPEGEAALFLGEEVCERGAVGVSFEGIELVSCVSQGAAPVGREVTITAADGNLIHELAGRPALEMVEQLISELGAGERALIAGGLLLGIVIDLGKPEYGQGDFLVRGVLGADPSTGTLVVGATVKPGQVVRLHVRNARSADEDLRNALRRRLGALPGHRAAGAIVFSCNGRGSAMFDEPDHDAALVAHELGGAPAAGFFAAGEIGPVGSRSFLHGYTATVAVFPQ
jgi:small ligand-binding sensory domain FIST